MVRTKTNFWNSTKHTEQKDETDILKKLLLVFLLLYVLEFFHFCLYFKFLQWFNQDMLSLSFYQATGSPTPPSRSTHLALDWTSRCPCERHLQQYHSCGRTGILHINTCYRHTTQHWIEHRDVPANVIYNIIIVVVVHAFYM